MNSRFLVVETSLNRAEFRWKALKLLQYTAILGSSVCLCLLFLGGAVLGGLVSDRNLALFLFGVVGAVAVLAWAIVAIGVMASSPERPSLAAALERVDHRLLDRLNTLLFLERRRGEPQAESFAVRIAKQTHGVLTDKPSPSPFSALRPMAHVLVLVFTLILTVLLYSVYHPLDHLVSRHKSAAEQTASAKPVELTLPPTNNIEQTRVWGEVRITDPGTDLKLTKVDVVPLQIEAASTQPLQAVRWFSTINGSQEVAHPLPTPSEPRYAVYQPTLYLDELNLSDWDVLTYYAKATTANTNSYGSEIYFIEVRPFREDIARMPGGEGGKAYQTLSEITTLIDRQQHVIRQTHKHVQSPPPQENLEAQDRRKLADAEADLSQSARHLYAKMAAEMENKPIGQALDGLAKAEASLDGAGKALQQKAMPAAQEREHQALSDLVAMRKMFQKAVSDNPDAFQQGTEEESSPVADSFKTLSQLAEFRDEAKAAEEFVDQTVAQQKKLDQESKAAPRSDFTRLGAEEQRLEKSLGNFQAQHPQAFKNTREELQQARQAMAGASDSLQNNPNEARAAVQQATRELEQFSQTMRSRSAAQQLADAYKLKQLLDQQARTLGHAGQTNSGISDDQLRETARDAGQTIDQLAKTAEQEPTRDAFGQPLREALSGTNKVDLDTKLKQLQMPDEAASKQQRAQEAGKALAAVSEAFARSQPKSLQAAQNADSLKPGEQDAFGQGLAELDSLLRQLESARPLSNEDQGKQSRQALMDLQSGLRSRHGNNERGNQLLLHLEQMLKAQTPLEVADLKKLMDQLQHFSVENSEKLAKDDGQAGVM
ncbi:MAG TPA: hypothetical protein VHI52_19360, partial [Verrucomicrobiae bacterium]|nr:hypothetical protein [Verrucomicrobiae bacterium]